ncbi:hypothetical protein [Riemerella columbina]|uniref:hypothetical protein n=1 Tax=Riemerella columbina TaxID=103810 RepID=UPI00036940D7|nr:hypothetical protein [Riemerella columbina]
MKYKLYFFIHFLVIAIISLNSVIYSYVDYKGIESENAEDFNELVNKFMHNSIYNSYAIFTGTNTGYGFYGINVATYKFFVVELYDSNDDLIHKTSTFDFKNKANLQRFDVLSSKIANSITEIKKNKDDDKKSKIFGMKKDLTKKIFKYIGLQQAKKYNNCKYYVVKLYTLIPDDIWDNENYNLLKNVAKYETYKFEL